MVSIPAVPSSSPVVVQKIDVIREQHKFEYILVDNALKWEKVSYAVAVIFFILGSITNEHWYGLFLLVISILLALLVAYASMIHSRILKKREFAVVVGVNEKFLTMFDLIAQGILTKDEFRLKATDLVGAVQVDRFFARRALATQVHNGDMTNEMYLSELEQIGYGPEQADEYFDFQSWLDQ
jgi:hypothetical protein